jgi:magnesium-transporting ATPase (P-type)
MTMTTAAARPRSWHTETVERVLAELGARPQGLTTEEARERLARYGPNRLRPPARRGPLVRFLAQFHNLLIYVLLGAAVMTALLGHGVDTAVILGVVIINAVIGFVQEGKAESALEAIRNMLPLQATVLRDGRRLVLPADEVVPGDVVFLQSGDKVPADLRLLAVKTLQIQEAALTGESVPVEKHQGSVPENAALGDRHSMAFSGTLVTYGQGRGLVVATGDATEIGRISGLLATVAPLTTPLLRQLAGFGRTLTILILAMAGLTFLFGTLLRDYSASEMFLAAVGIAVAAIPEGLPAIMTIALAIGVQRMAARRAIVRRLPAVETLGSVTVICSDKTGTLTRNEMTVQSIATAEGLYEVTGVGYAPRGAFLLDGEEVDLSGRPLLREMARCALRCCDAEVRQVEGDWVVHGDPTEGALVTLAMKAGLDPAFESQACPRADVIPFESEHRFMATLHHDREGGASICVKGAPERILRMCLRQRSDAGDEPLDAAYWHRRMEEIAARGQRLLAVALRATGPGHGELRFADVEDSLTLLGLLGLADPPREEAIAAVERCHAAGIRVKIITGDHAGTARAVGARLGLATTAVLTGSELDRLSDREFAAQAAAVEVFARTTPEHKLRLVEALQASGEVVAMTGDGVNDAPALKRADVGIAMGHKGTEAAKEAAEMVLADDNFATIANAVEEGRTVYDNLKKAIVFILPTNGGEALLLITAIAFGTLLPITPVQILWVNMVTTVTLALALAFEPAEPGVMAKPPRRPDEPLLSRFLLWRVVVVSLIVLVGTFGLFLFERAQGQDIEAARTVAVNTLVMFEAVYLFNTRYLSRSALSWQALLGSRIVLLAVAGVVLLQLLFTYAWPMQALFATRALDAAAWSRILLVASSLFLLIELEKWLLRRRSAGTGSRGRR